MRHKPILLWIIFLSALTVQAQDVQKIIRNVQKKYEGIKNLTAVFEQKEIFKLTGSVNQINGTLYIKNGEQYRFETEDQLIASDGKTLWTYNRLSGQLLIDNLSKNSAASLPRDIIYKYPKESFLSLISTEKKPAGSPIHVIKLEPKGEVKGFIQSIKLWVEDKSFNILQMSTIDINNNESHFYILSQDISKDLPAELFRIEPAPAMQVIDMRSPEK